MEHLLFEVAEDNPKNPLSPEALLTAQARFTLFFESPERADEMVQSVLDRDPGFGDALLVKAEILMQLGRPEEARTILHDLTRVEELPSWIRVEARRLLNSIEG